MKHPRIQKIGIAAVVVFLFSFVSHVALQTNAQSSQTKTPVILVHGYADKAGECDGIALRTYWNNIKLELAENAAIPAADIVPVSYYRCDTQGIDITGYGPGKTYPFTTTTGALKARAGHNSNTSITRVAQDLAWFIHNEYTQKGRPVNIVAHSMGGLITREAMRRVQAGDPAFPPRLDVGKVLTMSTPHNGWGKQCKTNTQCAQMSDGSQFLADLQTNPAPQGVNGTAWWAMAASGGSANATYLTATCDIIPTASATAVTGTHLVYTKPCYKHNAYLTDRSQKLDAVGSPEIAGRHSLRVMVDLMK